MAAVLTYGASMPVVKMGRMAGQFSKPRSADMETRGDVTLPSFRGETVNGFEFTPEARVHDPKRMLQGYHTSASTLNLIRAFTKGGFADLRAVHQWNRGFTSNPAHERYEKTAREIGRALKFMEACGVNFEALKTRVPSCPTTPPHTSCGLASAPAASTMHTWTSSPRSATPSA